MKVYYPLPAMHIMQNVGENEQKILMASKNVFEFTPGGIVC